MLPFTRGAVLLRGLASTSTSSTAAAAACACSAHAPRASGTRMRAAVRALCSSHLPLTYGSLVVLRDRKGRALWRRIVQGDATETHHGVVPHDAIHLAGWGGVVRAVPAKEWRENGAAQALPAMAHDGVGGDAVSGAVGHAAPQEWPAMPTVSGVRAARVRSSGFTHTVQRPTLEEYVLTGLHRAATPIYPKDAAAMVSMLDIQPGARVLEAGTGSGAMTLHLMRAVGGDGRVDTHEVRPEFYKRARKNVHRWLTRNGDMRELDAYEHVSFSQGDVGDATLHPEHYDAAVLDMMEPWKVLENVTRSIRPGCSIVCYLPNITQVTELLQRVGPSRLPLHLWRVVEVHQREWDVRQRGDKVVCHPTHQPVGHTGFLGVLRKMQHTL